MATRLDGNVRKATANTVAAMERSAARRQCPKCGRKSALKKAMEDWGDSYAHMTWCRWDDCGYEDVTVSERVGVAP